MQYHLAQVNIARMREPMDSPLLSTFVARLDEINALADGTAIRAYKDDLILVNLSVWERPEHLRHFVYKTMHAEVMKQRRTR